MGVCAPRPLDAVAAAAAQENRIKRVQPRPRGTPPLRLNCNPRHTNTADGRTNGQTAKLCVLLVFRYNKSFSSEVCQVPRWNNNNPETTETGRTHCIGNHPRTTTTAKRQSHTERRVNLAARHNG